VESAELPQAAFDFWPLLSQWPGQHWPLLCLLGAAALALIFRGWLLDQPAGRFWPVPAAFLPALIPFAREWDQAAPHPFKGCIVPGLLLAVAVLQLYGQERNNNDRNQQAARINGIATRIERISAGVDSVGSDVRRLADAIEALASQAQEETGEDN
jgi:outer membrane murein-binding lipoprotein Lpp